MVTDMKGTYKFSAFGNIYEKDVEASLDVHSAVLTVLNGDTVFQYIETKDDGTIVRHRGTGEGDIWTEWEEDPRSIAEMIEIYGLKVEKKKEEDDIVYG